MFFVCLSGLFELEFRISDDPNINNLQQHDLCCSPFLFSVVVFIVKYMHTQAAYFNGVITSAVS